jgi:hypothetical protein
MSPTAAIVTGAELAGLAGLALAECDAAGELALVGVPPPAGSAAD